MTPRTLLAFAAGPTLFFGVPFVLLALYATIDQGLALYRFTAWTASLFETPLGALAIVALLGSSSAIAARAIARD